MPIHEYRCTACGHEFEALVRGNRKPACPQCEGTDLARKLSAFSLGNGSSGESSGCCPEGTCCPGGTCNL